jgi:hypothetical protein
MVKKIPAKQDILRPLKEKKTLKKKVKSSGRFFC